MPRLPEDPSLEHLKNQAKTLLARAREGDEQARAWVREYHPDPPAQLKLADAQLVVARAYGFPSWPKLHAHLEVVEHFSRSPHKAPKSEDAADEFLRLACLTYSSDDPARREAAREMLTPELARASLHTAAAAGDLEAARGWLEGGAASRGDGARGAGSRGEGAPEGGAGSRGEGAPAGGAGPRGEVGEGSRGEGAPAGGAGPRGEVGEGSRGEGAPAGGAGPRGEVGEGSRDEGAPAGGAGPRGAGSRGEGAARAARTLGGPHRWEPLLYLAYSRATGPQALDVARLLLDHGADPNAGFLWDGLPSPFTALTGAFGRGEGDPPPHADALALARILLEAGADPTDTQATYNLHWSEDDAWLELLLEFGYGRGDGGPWHARLAPAHPTPRETAEDCLMWAALEGFPRRTRLLLDAGVDPDGRGTRHPILKGRTALEVALLEGRTEVALALQAAGAREPELERAQRVEAAYMAADASVTDPPPPGLIARAAGQGNAAAVALLLERGADVNAPGERATALHEAAWRGDTELVEVLLQAGADRTLRDRQFGGTPSNWAGHAGHVELSERLTP